MELTIEDERHLADELVGWLTTVHDGQPQSSPVGYLWALDSVWIRSEPHQHKVRNVTDNPLVSFHLELHTGRVVSMECWTALVDEFPQSVREEFTHKYAAAGEPAVTAAERERQFSTCLRLSPTRIRSW